MNKSYTFDRCLNSMNLNMELIEELEMALGELQTTISTDHCTSDQTGTADLDFQAAAA